MKADKSFPIINAFLFVLVLLVLGVVVFLLYRTWQNSLLNESLNNNREQIQTPNTDEKKNNESDQTKNYSAKSATFTFSYPNDWSVEENQDAAFTIIRDSEKNNAVTIRVSKKPASINDLPFDQYAKNAAKQEIQGFEDLASFEEIVTTTGVKGYKTTWKVKFLGADEFVSNPITYFEHPFDPSKSIQFNLENANYGKQYDAVIRSYEIIK